MKNPKRLYLEFVNDWLTITAMAEYYGISRRQMTELINEGREKYNKQYS